MVYAITEREYGKSLVKLLHVKRDGLVHTIKEFEVATKLKLNSEKDYIEGNNEDIVATDSQKNTVYLLAKRFGVSNPERFALLLARHFLNQYSHVVRAKIEVVEHPWKRITYSKNGPQHNHAFVSVPDCERSAKVTLVRNGTAQVESGLNKLQVLKTTQSAFVNFYRDEFASLPDMEDRIFSTVVKANWTYDTIANVNFDQAFEKVKLAILRGFAGCPDRGVYSPSVQQSMYLIQKDILDQIRQLRDVYMQMPNKHYFSVDLSKFPRVGSKTNDEVFLPVDKPSGMIEATLARNDFRAKM
ncbi:uricase-like [Tigriopus californicus]|uniref:uricase-like n=1 Tax=Tigriopus californicus TaxID=6832 RepID=UPI0027DA2FF7|nr:uricase-like [Tigriopus californicus]